MQSSQLNFNTYPISKKVKGRTSKLLKVVMFGPCLSEKGGMGTVQKHIVRSVTQDIKIKHIATWTGSTNTTIVFFKGLLLFIYKLLRNQVDIIHIHVSERGSFLRKSIIAILAFIFSKPVIMHTHGCEFHIFHDSLYSPFKHLLNKVLQSCACVIVLSESWKEVYERKCGLSPSKVLVRYNPVVTPASIPSRASSDKVVFLILGKVNERKGVFDLLNALAKLPAKTRENVELIVAGSGEVDKAIALTKELNIDSLVRFTGWVNYQIRDELLAETDVFVLPSYNEGLPMALLEAMAWKIPVITTPVGGIPEVIEHGTTGLLVEPGDVKAITNSMLSLIENQSLRDKFGKASYKKASLLDIKNYSKDILDLYHYLSLGQAL